MTFRRRVSWTIYTTRGKDRSELLQLYSFRVGTTISTYILYYIHDQSYLIRVDFHLKKGVLSVLNKLVIAVIGQI